MNPALKRLEPYPFEKLRALFKDSAPAPDLSPISLAIGEPKHPCPPQILETIAYNQLQFGKYPNTKGLEILRQTIANWCQKRYQLETNTLDPETNILPVCGTREALFSITQAVVDRTQSPTAIMPNPCYQIYEGAAMLAGAEPYYLPTHEDNNFLLDITSAPTEILERCQILYVCSPGNPSGTVIDLEGYQTLFDYADRYDFIIVSDECYSELYIDESAPPLGILEACEKLGRKNFDRCLAFGSLSKRSNVPGLRSGFVAGDANILRYFLKYRTYHGCTIPLPLQAASITAWEDEQHVLANRDQYREKYSQFTEKLKGIWELEVPPASFYLWAKTPIDDREFAKLLREQQNITVLPGQYLSRTIDGYNPGLNRVRLALVATLEETNAAAERLIHFFQTNFN